MPTTPPDEQMDGASAGDSDDKNTTDDDTEDEIAQVPDNAEEKDGRAVDEEDTVHGMMRTTRARRTIMRRGREYDDRESDAVITIRPVRAI